MNQKKEKENDKQPKNLFTWTAHEFEIIKKEPKWFLVAGLILIGLIIIAILLHYWLFVAVLVLSIVVLFTYANQMPKQKSYKITEESIHIGTKDYPLTSFKSFWIAQTPRDNILYLEGAHRYSMPISLQLGDQNIEKVREALGKVLPEQPRGEDVVDQINRIIRF